MDHQKLDKIVDIMVDHAGRFDKLDSDLGAVIKHICQIAPKIDAVIELQMEITQNQLETERRIKYLEEQQKAAVELFVGLSKRVERIEGALAPTPMPCSCGASHGSDG